MATETLRPNTTGDSGTFTDFPAAGANWEKCDEEVADDNTTYVYNITDPTFDVGATINSVTVYWRCFRAGTNYKIGYYGIKSGATESWTGPTTFGAAYADYSTVYNTNPDTGLAWTKAAITALQVGVKTAADATPGMTCTQIYAVVDYTAAVTYIPKQSYYPHILAH
jgi:hypothetical protein